MKNVRVLNANAIKFLAAAIMVIDHVGLLFFPQTAIFRYIGRVSMPLFAFAVSEGCRYTKNKTKHFGRPNSVKRCFLPFTKGRTRRLNRCQR